MEICQYEFTFQDEYMEILDEEVSGLLEISSSLDNAIRVDTRDHTFILKKKDKKNFIIYSIHGSSYMYLLIVKCEKKYEEKLKSILLNVCAEIEDDYGEDHKKEVRNVINESDNWFLKLQAQYDLIKMFNF